MSEAESDSYGLSSVVSGAEVAAPTLPYLPREPQRYRPAIGLVGCGGIAAQHLAAYRAAGYRVVALCDRNLHKVRERAAAYFPDAAVYTDVAQLLARDDIEVVDLTPHPHDRADMIAAALEAGKHVLSQKPFVLDLDVGERLVELADRRGLKLAVNQNGRWAPHFAYLRAMIQAGLLGDLTSVRCSAGFDHSWTIETPFNRVRDLVLFDFAIHWFDIVTAFFGARAPQRVFATSAQAIGQRAWPPFLAHATLDYGDALAAIAFNATVVYGQHDRTTVCGTLGTAVSQGPSLSEQQVTIDTAAGTSRPALTGTWFREGFHGTMAELLCAIEERREPANGARENLRSLALAFAAVASERAGAAAVPGSVRRLPA